jgi:hypothetical protein
LTVRSLKSRRHRLNPQRQLFNIGRILRRFLFSRQSQCYSIHLLTYLDGFENEQQTTQPRLKSRRTESYTVRNSLDDSNTCLQPTDRIEKCELQPFLVIALELVDQF